MMLFGGMGKLGIILEGLVVGIVGQMDVGKTDLYDVDAVVIIICNLFGIGNVFTGAGGTSGR